MRLINDSNNSFLCVTEEKSAKKVRNFILAIYASAGHGKGLVEESIVYSLYKLGFLIVILSDPKNEIEYGYSMFPPTEAYHLDHLRKIGRKPEKISVKIYHPYTNSIPNIMLPDINFYTFSLKEMGRDEWSMLAETEFDSETVKLLNNAKDNIKPDDGILGLLHFIQDAVKGKKESRRQKPDSRNFYLSVGAGNPRSITDIAGCFQIFKHDTFLTSENCPLNINWKEILEDQKSYHVFVNNWIRDEKLKDFLVLSLFNGILRNKEYLKTPICFVIPEIRRQLPERPKGYKVFLANTFKNNLSTIRSMAKGMSAVMDSQSFTDTNPLVKNSASETFFGRLSPEDSENVAKTMNYRRETREKLTNMQRGCFLRAGFEDLDEIALFFPPHAHCEEHTSFFEEYKKYYADKMRKYSNIKNLMQDLWKKEEERIKEKVKRIEREEKERIRKIKKEREESVKSRLKVEERLEKAKEMQSRGKREIMRLVYESKVKDNKSFRQLGKEFNITDKTAKTYFEEYQKEIEKENSEDFENKFLEDEDIN